MSMTRRDFVALAATGTAVGAFASGARVQPAQKAAKTAIKAIAFDACIRSAGLALPRGAFR
jgi:hypothetical protein